ncbi:V-type ATPase subunit [Alkalibacter mobilis]|uniref:V-type ATPase subunit n=1 Tax=Alkalibacter mobilis TaxID=2787712 RepID=UPI00189F893E|nr:V-type ATPase subunit [Alkalibacter mobilis]MBF7096554.1 V-type ATPase subunit [Alkalibacter mobilis]
MFLDTQSDAIYSKTSALKSKMLQMDDYKALMGKDNVRQIYDYLLEFSVYGEKLAELRGQKIHRGDVERALYMHLISSIEKILHYLGGDYRKFIIAYLKKFEIEDIKLAIESVTGRTSITDLENHILSTDSFSKIDIRELLAQETLQDLMEKLKGTDYYRLLIPYTNQVDSKFSFYVEMILDRFYYSQLIKAAKKLPDADLKGAVDLLERNIDLYNLEWLYRARKFYDMSKEEIINFVLDSGKKFNYFQLKDLVYESDFQKMIGYLSSTDYGFLFNHDWDIDLYMERRIERYLFYKSLNLYGKSVLDFSKVYAFIMLMEFEVKDIISIIECKRYKLPIAEISKYLIRDTEVVEQWQ